MRMDVRILRTASATKEFGLFLRYEMADFLCFTEMSGTDARTL